LAALALLLAGCPREVKVPSSPEALNGNFAGEARLNPGARDLQFAADGSQVLVALPSGLESRRPDGTLAATQPPAGARGLLSPDGARLAAISYPGLLRVLPLAGGPASLDVDLTPTLSGQPVAVLAWDATGTRLLVTAGTERPLVLVVDAGNGAVLRRLERPRPVGSLAMDAAGHLAIVDWDEVLSVLDAGGTVLRSQAFNSGVVLSPDGRWAAARERYLNEVSPIGVWDVLTGLLLRELPASTTWPDALAITNSGVVAEWENSDPAWGSEAPSGVLRVFDPDGTLAATIENPGRAIAQTLALDAAGRHLAASDLDGRVFLWSLPSTSPVTVETSPAVAARANLSATYRQPREYAITGTLDIDPDLHLSLEGTVTSGSSAIFAPGRLRPAASAGMALGTLKTADGHPWGGFSGSPLVYGGVWTLGVTQGFDNNAGLSGWHLRLSRQP
ncbi:MAG TPA: hypothetical protein VHN99_07615, partial [Deinococcales bacterium]|nr:hypothetical protein [Deinococcales bacterium]